jgi:hypothetical protein
MTEVEWLACSDPRKMLECLGLKQAAHPDMRDEWTPLGIKPSDRKMRLFAVASCRRIWDLLRDERSRQAVEMLAAYLENQLGERELQIAEREAEEANKKTENGEHVSRRAASAVSFALSSEELRRVGFTYVDNAICAAQSAVKAHDNHSLEESAKSHIIRDIFGPLPFRNVGFPSAWVTSDVLALAQPIYDERAFERMPILADALEDAGCDNPDILEHCRQPGEHARGCWVVDLVLGKK